MTPLDALAQTIAQADAAQFGWGLAALGAVALGLLYFGFRRLSHARLMEDMPTSLVRSAAQGYVELKGHARLLPGPLIVSPLSGERCCWWEYRIEHLRTHEHDGRRRSEWVTIDHQRSEELFLLADTTGQCIIDPHGARVMPSLRRRWRGYHARPQRFPKESPWFSLGDYRYTESLIRYGDVLYSLGHFESQVAQRAQDEALEVSARLQDWKQDQASLLQRFDRNGDGAIDMAEWSAAREAALADVRREHVEQNVQTDLHVLREPRDSRPYLLSTRTEAQMTRSDRWQGLGCIALGTLGVGAALLALTLRGLI